MPDKTKKRGGDDEEDINPDTMSAISDSDDTKLDEDDDNEWTDSVSESEEDF